MQLQGDWDVQRSGPDQGWSDTDGVTSAGLLIGNGALASIEDPKYINSWSDSGTFFATGAWLAPSPARTTALMHEWDLDNALSYGLRKNDPGTISGGLRSLFFGSLGMNYNFTSAISFTGPSGTGGGTPLWSASANWGNGVPNAAGAFARFDANASINAVAVDVATTVGVLVLDSTSPYTISGSSTLTLDQSTDVNPQVVVQNGSHTVSSSIHLAKPTDFTVNGSGNTLTISGSVSSASGVTLNKYAEGKLVVPSVRTSGLAVRGGTLEITTNGGNAGTSKVSSLAVVNAILDLKDNDLIVADGGIAPVRALIFAGYGTGSWNGTSGVITTGTPPTGKTVGLGYAQGDDPKVSGLGGSLTGQSFDADSALVKFTYRGDADLDGDVDGSDIGVWSTNYTGSGGSTSKLWTQGDWDYDGDVDGIDSGLWSSNYTGSGAGVLDLPGANPTAIKILQDMGYVVVPEPVAVGALLLAFIPGRRSRR
jgi:hypothetical protein